MILPFVSIAEIREQFTVLKNIENESLEEFEEKHIRYNLNKVVFFYVIH